MKTVRSEGNCVAIVEAGTGEQCTFRDLDARAAAWANLNLSGGSQWRGAAVLFALPNGIRWLEAFLGLIYAGAVPVPLDAAEPARAQQEYAESLRAAGYWTGEKLVRRHRVRRFRGDVAVIKLTSGSTGRPRPLPFLGTELLADARQVTLTMGFGRRDLNYALIPFGHSYGLGNLTLPLIAHGVPIVCGTAPLPHAVANDFAAQGPSIFPSVPAFWRALAGADVDVAAFRNLRLAISAGAPLPPDVARSFEARFHRRLHNFYGSSETGGIAYDRSGVATLNGGVGKPMRGVWLRIERGRLTVASAAVMTRGNPRRMGRHARWMTPDRVVLNERGELMLLGRTGKIVKIGGRRMNVAEVVAHLRRLPGVTDAWVAASERPESILGAAVISHRAPAELRAELQTGLPAWKVPKKWAIVPEWPLTDRGKIDTRALHRAVFGPSA